MNLLLKYLVAFSALSCSSPKPEPAADMVQLGQSSFAFAARYGTPASYQHLGEYLQLNYGCETSGCQIFVLIDHTQCVAGRAATGKSCQAH